jgi:Vacuolar protein sorting-associated protein 62
VAGLALVPASGGASASTPSLATLLARHVPVLVLHPAERFAPVRVEGFLADSDLQRRTATGWETIAEPLPAGGADLRLDQRSCSAIDGLAASECYAAVEDAHASEPVVYGKAFRTATRIDLQYWIWYPYDDWSPTVAPGEVWQVHEGDWEAVSVILDTRGVPLVAGCSQHMAGKRREWSRVAKRGLRPLVYVALGSHANFFEPGTHPFGPRTVSLALIAVLKAYGVAPVDLTARGRTVRPRLVRVSAASPSWMAFAGAWGETGYVHVPGRDPIPTGLGPSGPAFHAQWRSPARTVLNWPRG